VPDVLIEGQQDPIVDDGWRAHGSQQILESLKPEGVTVGSVDGFGKTVGKEHQQIAALEKARQVGEPMLARGILTRAIDSQQARLVSTTSRLLGDQLLGKLVVEDLDAYHSSDWPLGRGFWSGWAMPKCS